MSKSLEQLRSAGVFGSRTAHQSNAKLSEGSRQTLNEGVQVGHIVRPTPKYLKAAQWSVGAPKDGVVLKIWGAKGENALVLWNNVDKPFMVRLDSLRQTGKDLNQSKVKQLQKKHGVKEEPVKGKDKVPGKEANQEPPVIAALRKIVKHKQFAKVPDPVSKKKTSVDMLTARAIITVYDALKPEQKATYVKFPLVKMANMAFKLVRGKRENQKIDLEEAQLLMEGLYDPFILKAVFMAGGPGSGKGFYGKKLFAGTGVKVVNSDDQFERFMKQAGLSLKTQVGSPQAQAMRPKAKAVTTAKMGSLASSRIGIVIDGTAKEASKVVKMKKRLESLGYDTAMVMINTSLETAHKRNQARDRTVPEKIVTKSWKEVQAATKTYRSAFGKDFHEIDGNKVYSAGDVRSKLIPKMNNLGLKILKQKLRNPKGWRWLVDAVKALGITDPSKVTHLGKVGLDKAQSLAGGKTEGSYLHGGERGVGTIHGAIKTGNPDHPMIGLFYDPQGKNGGSHFWVKSKNGLVNRTASLPRHRKSKHGGMPYARVKFYQMLANTLNFGSRANRLITKLIKTTLKEESKLESLTEGEAFQEPVGSSKGRERVRSKVGYVVKDNIFSPVGPIEKAKKLDPGIYEIKQSMAGTFFEVSSVTTDALLRFKDSRYEETLKEISKFWTLKEKYASMGFPHKRGVLLYGPPGTGKSCLLKMVIEEMVEDGNVVLKTRSPGTLMSGLKALREVEKDRKVLCILEDVDELCRYNEHAILQLFDGDSTVDNVCYLATTNYLERLPPRILRSGRFDRKVKVVAPPKEGRMAYFQAKLGLNEDEVELNEIVDLTDGFTFAEMKEFLVSAYILDVPPKVAAHRVRTGLEESVHSPEALDVLVENLERNREA